jgi:hypothetical protein
MTNPDNDMLRAVPLLSGVPDSTIHAVHGRGAYVDVAAGEEITRRWDSDRFFYIILSGRYDIFIEARLIRTLGPGDTSASSPPATGEAATATPVPPPSGAPNQAGSSD